MQKMERIFYRLYVEGVNDLKYYCDVKPAVLELPLSYVIETLMKDAQTNKIVKQHLKSEQRQNPANHVRDEYLQEAMHPLFILKKYPEYNPESGGTLESYVKKMLKDKSIRRLSCQSMFNEVIWFKEDYLWIILLEKQRRNKSHTKPSRPIQSES